MKIIALGKGKGYTDEGNNMLLRPSTTLDGVPIWFIQGTDKRLGIQETILRSTDLDDAVTIFRTLAEKMFKSKS